jgi:hypothetical protein
MLTLFYILGLTFGLFLHGEDINMVKGHNVRFLLPSHMVLNGSKGALSSYSLHGMVANLKHQSFFNTR